MSRHLRPVGWPALATLVSVALLLGHSHALGLLSESWGVAADLPVLPLLLGSASYFSAAWLAGRLIGLAVEGGRGGQRRPAPRLLQDLVNAALFVAALVATIALVFDGSLLGAAATSGVIVAVIGFSLRNVMADIFSGIALSLERPYRIGDWVETEGGLGGRVVEINWRSTRLETRDQTHVILPNGRIAQQILTNFSAPRRQYRDQIRLTLDHGLPVESARALLARAAAETPGLLDEPAPDVRVLAHEPAGVTYAVRFWVPSYALQIDCRDAVFAGIDAALRRQGVPPPHARHLVAGGVPAGG